MICLVPRISVSNDPLTDSDWEVVLQDSLVKDGQDVSTDIKYFPLDSNVNGKRFVKFEILSFEDTQGCIQYFDVVREPKFERTGISTFISDVLVF